MISPQFAHLLAFALHHAGPGLAKTGATPKLKAARLAIYGFVLFPSIALAIDFGKLDLYSALNQNFNAEISTILGSEENPTAIKVKLASQSQYLQKNLSWNENLKKLSIKNNDSKLIISSLKPINTPQLTLLLEIKTAKSLEYLQYNLQLKPAPITSEDQAGENKIKNTDFGPIRNTDTLWSIAAKLAKEQNVATDKMLTALRRVNENAFYNGNADNLKSGIYLHIPDLENPVKAGKTNTVVIDSFNKTTIETPTPISQPVIHPLAAEPVKEESKFIDEQPEQEIKTRLQNLEQKLAILEKSVLSQQPPLPAVASSFASNATKLQDSPIATPNTHSFPSLQLLAMLSSSFGAGIFSVLGWQYWQKLRLRPLAPTQQMKVTKSKPLVQAKTPVTSPALKKPQPDNERATSSQQYADIEFDPAETQSLAEIEAYNGLARLRRQNELLANLDRTTSSGNQQAKAQPITEANSKLGNEDKVEKFLFDFDFSAQMGTDTDSTDDFQSEMLKAKKQQKGK
jgi:FimV-like protein